MISRLFSFTASIVIFAATAASAQSIAPEALAAEASGNWDTAIALHQAALRENPARTDLWIRVSDIEAARQNLPASIAALQRAARISTADASVFARLSQAHALAGQRAEALAAIEIAVAQSPDSVAYLRAKATLATWNADYRLARDSYRRLLRLQPEDEDLFLQHARVSAWDGSTDEAVASYRNFLRKRPENAAAWIELAKAESWRGNYAAAAEALETYRKRFGTSPAYDRAHAAVMASGGRPRKASEAVASLLEETPEDYQLNLTHAISLAMQNRSREAFESLDTIQRLEPLGRETRNAEQILRTILASAADPRASFYSDSDQLQVLRVEPRASAVFQSGTRVSGGYERSRLDARIGSGLEQMDGSLSAQHDHLWAGAAQRLGMLTVSGQFGYATAGPREMSTYNVGAELKPVDGLRIAAERSTGFFVISPRTVGLGITETSHRLQVDLMPAMRYQVAMDASYRELSDGNSRWEVAFAPRRSFARTARVNLDLGVSAYMLGTAHDMNHGYYDPRVYEQYAFTAYPYFKVRENIGLALTAAMGVQRDRTTPGFHFGGTVTSEATFGIYKPWVLKVAGSATLNRRLESGAYRGVGGMMSLIRRF